MADYTPADHARCRKCRDGEHAQPLDHLKELLEWWEGFLNGTYVC